MERPPRCSLASMNGPSVSTASVTASALRIVVALRLVGETAGEHPAAGGADVVVDDLEVGHDLA